MREEGILKRFTAEQLSDEAGCVEETEKKPWSMKQRVWLHMYLMGYMPDELRELANKAEERKVER